MQRTSKDSPIRVDLLPESELRLPGRLGMTFAPGKKGAGIDVRWARDLRTDLTAIKEQYGASRLVTLMEDWELEHLGIADIFTVARDLGLVTKQVPIVDGGVPRSFDVMIDLVGEILDALGRGETVVVHCRGGLGRTGTAAACCLVGRGHTADAAIRVVRYARPNTVETTLQERFVHDFAERARGRWA
jgi:protein-tyrosine phosphatase